MRQAPLQSHCRALGSLPRPGWFGRQHLCLPHAAPAGGTLHTATTCVLHMGSVTIAARWRTCPRALLVGGEGKVQGVAVGQRLSLVDCAAQNKVNAVAVRENGSGWDAGSGGQAAAPPGCLWNKKGGKRTQPHGQLSCWEGLSGRDLRLGGLHERIATAV